jgi:hypothetical protein
MTPGGLIETAAFDTADGLYDACWAEDNENILLAACADGSVKVGLGRQGVMAVGNTSGVEILTCVQLPACGHP